MVKRRSYRKQHEKRLENAFKATSRTWDNANQKVIKEPRHWEGFEDSVTYRKNGQVVAGAYRNIQDLGNLGNSQTKTTTLVGDYTTTLDWDGNGITNPIDVMFGQYTKNYTVAGRDWVKIALAEVNLTNIFQEEYNNG